MEPHSLPLSPFLRRSTRPPTEARPEALEQKHTKGNLEKTALAASKDDVGPDGIAAESPQEGFLGCKVAAARVRAGWIETPCLPKAFEGTVKTLAMHSRSKRMAGRSKRQFIHRLSVSLTVGFWAVILVIPWIVPPLGEYLWDVGCYGLEFDECSLNKNQCFWRTQRHGAVCKAKRHGYLIMWGPMLLQFLYAVQEDYGSTVKSTIQGAMGTAIPWLNMLFLNHGVSFVVGGGAFASRRREPESRRYNSRWLPLCSSGFGDQQLYVVDDDEGTPSPCIFNIWWTSINPYDGLVLAIVWADIILIIFICLALNIEDVTRMFALSTHVYFMMRFINPEADDFEHFPSLADYYMIMVLCASCMAILCFRCPRRRFTALGIAKDLCGEVRPMANVLFESLAGVPSPLIRVKVEDLARDLEEVVKEMDSKLNIAWFEDLGFGRLAQQRRRMVHFTSCLRKCTSHLPGVFHAAQLLSEADLSFLELHYHHFQLISQSLSKAFLLDFDAKDVPVRACLRESHIDQIIADASTHFSQMKSDFSPEGRAYLFAAYRVLMEAREAQEQFESVDQAAQDEVHRSYLQKCMKRICTILRGIWGHCGSELIGQSPTHARFVVRNTFSICFAFFLGWIGIPNVVPVYESYMAATIALVLYTYTGTSAPVTIKRVAGVVFGKTLGTIVQLMMCRAWWASLLVGFSMFSVVTLMFFLYLQLDKDIGFVCCLTGAFAAQSMIPGSFRLRKCDTVDFDIRTPDLMKPIISTVIGVGILTFVDVLFASSASNQAKQLLLRTFTRAKVCILKRPSKGIAADALAFKEDLDALKCIIPYAVQEPRYWKQPFRFQLYVSMEKHLRAISSHMETLTWALGFGETPRSPCVSFVIDDGRRPVLDDLATSKVGADDSSFGLPSGSMLPAVAFLPILAVFRRDIAEMIGETEKALLCTFKDERAEDSGPREILRVLENSLYTVWLLKALAIKVSTLCGMARNVYRNRDLPVTLEHPLTQNCPDVLEGGRRQSKGRELEVPGEACPIVVELGIVSQLRKGKKLTWCERLRNQLVHENLNMPVMDSSSEAKAVQPSNDAISAKDMVAKLLEEMRDLPTVLPHLDDLCRFELVVLMVNSMMMEVKSMQIEFAEF